MAVLLLRADAAEIPKQLPPRDGLSDVDLIAKATKGDIRARLSLAYRYRDGKGVRKDYAEAMRWAHLAADRGDAAAMDFVGWMFFQGLGVKHNPTVAAGYFKAAAGESAAAALNLGQCYFGAQGVEHDVPKAWRSGRRRRPWATGAQPPRRRWSISQGKARRRIWRKHTVLPRRKPS